MFYFWDLVMQLQQIFFQLVKSLRLGNWELYVNSVKSILAWFFIFDHPNYARWVSIHLYDILSLSEYHPDLVQACQKGYFSVQQRGRHFSSIGLDQAHEQINCEIKCSGGAVGIFSRLVDLKMDGWWT